MSDGSRHRIPALLLSIVPGWGHVYWGRETLGLALFTAAAICGFAFLNGLVVYRGDGRSVLVWISGALLAAVACAAWIDVALRTSPRRVDEDRLARRNLLRQGAIAYVRGDLDTAEADFRSCLRIDPQDVEALFRLGVTLARKAVSDREAHDRDRATARAIAALRRAQRFDLEDKWVWELEREIDALRARNGVASGAATGPGGAETSSGEAKPAAGVRDATHSA